MAGELFMAEPGGEKKVVPMLAELGVTGLQQFSGYVMEEKLRQLQGAKAMEVYREMSDNDDIVGALNFLFEMVMRKVDWKDRPASDDPDDVEVAEFTTSCRMDMSHTWEDHIAEAVSMIPFGWASCEIVYKRRLGPTQADPTSRSQYNDGMIGWRKLPIRAQETLSRWEFDTDGGIKGWYQLPPQGGQEIFLPIEKLLHFRTTSKKNNPEGRSFLRNAFVPYVRKKEMERIEAIGAERDLAGLPVIYVPPEILDPNAPAEVKAIRTMYENIGKNVRNDEQSYVMLPGIYDDKGNRIVELTLAGTNSRRLIDTNQVIERYSRRIAMSVLADVILLGHERVGSFALASSKTDLMVYGMVALLDVIASVHNRFGYPRLLRVNGIPPERQPTLVHGDLEKDDITIISNAVAALFTAGALTPGGEPDENYLRDILGMPPAPNSNTALNKRKRRRS